MSSHKESLVGVASKKGLSQQEQRQSANKKESVSTKILQRLNNLTPSTSKESIQAFAKWLLFHVTVNSTDAVCTTTTSTSANTSTADGSKGITSGTPSTNSVIDTLKNQSVNNNRVIYRTLKQVLTLDPKLLQFSNGGSGSDHSHDKSNEQNAENTRAVMKWSKMLNIYWYIIHELCICYHDSSNAGAVMNKNNNNKSDGVDTENKKWIKYTSFRSMLAENVILPLLQDLLELLELCSKGSIGGNDDINGNGGDNNDSNTITTVPVGPPLIVITAISNAIKDLPLVKDHHQTKKVDTFHSKWEDIDSFQSPTLLDDMKRVIVKIAQFDSNKAKEEHQQQQRQPTKKLGEAAAPERGNEDQKIRGDRVGSNDKDEKGAKIERGINSSTKNKAATVQEDDGKDLDATAVDAAATTNTADSMTPDKKDDSSSASMTTPSTPNSNIVDHHHDDATTAADTTPTVTSDTEDVVMAENNGDGIDEDLFGGGDDENSDSNKNKNNNNTNNDHDNTQQESSKNEESDNKNKAVDDDNSSSVNSTKQDSNDKLTKDGTSKSKKRGFVDLDADIDFDKEGIPKGRVEVHELEVPCQTIGKMQISRDLRNDFSLNLSSALSLVPQKVYEECDKALENKDNSEATISSIVVDEEDSLQIPNEVLDYNLSDALSNIRLHRKIIEKQMEARRKCMELLVKSRCEFGSKVDAETFYSLDKISESLTKRKAQILDAMELEGLDFEGLGEGGNDQNDDTKDEQPTTFTWYTKEEAKMNRDIKKQRVE